MEIRAGTGGDEAAFLLATFSVCTVNILSRKDGKPK